METYALLFEGIPYFIFKLFFMPYCSRASRARTNTYKNKSMGGAATEEQNYGRRYLVYHDVLVDEVRFPKGGKIQISPKLEHYCANQDQIRN